jgi:ligand-binding sensor domain-containing protein/signal transduction histidine kinase
MNAVRRVLLFGVVFFGTQCDASAQPYRLQFKHLTPDDGLSSSTATCFLKDQKGFMWIGTYYGLNRYDGYRFTTYNNNSLDTTSLAHDLVYTIFEDRGNNLWIGTQEGLSLYDWQRDRFVNYMQSGNSPLNAYNYNVLSIAEDSAGNLWLATNQGLICFDRKHNKAELFAAEADNPRSLSYSNVEKVFIDSRGNLWVSTRKGLNLYRPETKDFLRISAGADKRLALAELYFTDIAEDQDGSLWFGTYGRGLLRYNPKNRNHPWTNFHHRDDDDRSLSAERVHTLFIDKQGELWVGLENGGLDLFNRKKEQFWRYRANELDPNSLNNESIYAIYEDELRNYWIGTFAGGINISKFNSGAILEYTNLPGVPTSLSNNSVTCFMEDHLGRIWVGTDGGGLNLFDSETGRFTQFNSRNTNLTSDALLSIIEDSEHRIWVGTWGGGLARFEMDPPSFQAFTTSNSSIPDNNIFSITEDKKGNLWLGSFQSGLIRYDKKSRRFTKYDARNSGLSLSMITVVRQIPDGRLMIGTPSGLNIFDAEKKAFKTYFHLAGNASSLSSNGIHDIVVENDSSIWIGADNGLNRFDPRTELFTGFSMKDGLPDNVIKGLVFDLAGNLWIGTNKGVCRLDIERRKCKNFVRADGLQSNEFNNRSALRLRDGRIFLGGTRGFNVFYPDKIKENKNVPRVLITDFFVFNKPMTVGAPDSPLEAHISETTRLSLSYRQSMISFQFTSMDFTVPEKNQYAYMMEGFEKNWNYVGTQRTATYTNLDPGRYVFRVKASNNDGVWNEEGASLEITIAPPFWETAWFRGLGILVVAGMIVGWYKVRTGRMRARNRELERHITERTAQLETANNELEAANKELEAFAYSVSHDLRAPLRAIDGYTNILLEDYEPTLDEEGKRVCTTICNETQRMGQLIDDLLSFSHVSRADMQVAPINMEALASSVYYELTTPESRGRIEFQVGKLPEAVGDATLIREVWMNLLSNAIKFSSKRERAEIEVGYRQEGEKVIYTVKDNGAGFDMRYADKLFTVFWRLHSEKEFEGTGVGLAIVQRLVHRHGGKVWADSQVDKGATFFFTIEGAKR